MKNFIFVFILIFYSAFIFSQVNFELDFSFEKIDPDDELTNLQLFDYDDDGVDEIFTGYNREDVLLIVCNDLTGDTLFTFEYEKMDDEVFQRMQIFSINNSKYLITCSIIDIYEFEYDNLILIRIFDIVNFEEILSFNFDTEVQIMDLPVLPSINQIMTINNQDNMQIFVSYNDGWYLDMGGVDPHNHDETFISKFNFDNDQLIFLETIPQVGLEIIYLNSIDYILTIGFEHDWGGMTAPFNFWHYYLKKLSNETPAYVQNILTIVSYIDGFPLQFKMLTKNNCYSQLFGNLLYIRYYNSVTGNYIEMKNYSEDLSEILWERNDTETGTGNITASTCVSTNEGDHFVLYFRGNLYEVRNRITGDIKLSGVSMIIPFEILRKSDEELFFFVEQEDETGYDVYVLDGEIQVSVNNNQLPIAIYQLKNYPNPFNPTTMISFFVAQTSSFVTLDIFNIKGQKVKTLVNELLPAGEHSIVWDSKNSNGNRVSSGIYLYQIQTGSEEQVRKMLLLK